MRGKSEEKLNEFFPKESLAEAFEYIFESASDAISILDTYGNFATVNRRAEALTGFKREDLTGKSFRELISPESLPKTTTGFLSAIKGKSIRLELRLKTAVEKTVLVEVTITPIISNRKTVGALWIVRDVSERKKAEKALQKPEEMFKTLMEEAPIGICNTNLKGKITYVNKRFEEAIGYSRKEIIGKNGFKLGIMPDETLKLFLERLKKRLMGKPSRLLEGQFKRKDGEWMWAEVEGRLIKKFGVPVGFQLIARDITERKRAEEERKCFAEKLSALNNYGQNLNTARSMKEIYELTLDAAEKTLGFEFADILITKEKTLCLATHRGYSRISSLKLSLDGNKGITARAARTGKPVFVPDISKEKAYVEGGYGMRSELAVPMKIRERILGVLNVESKELDAFNEKDQELLEILASHAATAISNLEYAQNLEMHTREIRENQEKFERLFMGNPEASVYMDPSFHILDVNPRFSEVFGYSLNEVKGKHIDDVVVPENKREEAKMLKEKFIKGPVYYDTIRRRKDGTSVSVSISGAPIIVDGQLVGTVGLYKDITERKQMEQKLEEYSQHLEELVEKRTGELKEAQAQLLRAERLAAIGEIAAMIGHDLRNPLTAIAGAAYYLKTKQGPKKDKNTEEMLELIERGVRNSNHIITDLLDYSREIRLEPTETTPKIITRQALSSVVVPKNIKVRDLTEDEPKIKVDVDKIVRVFINMLRNAIEAMPEGGKFTIKSKEENGSLEITFIDTGIGMSKETLEKIGTPLFTTKAKGMGLGLPICKRIVEAHQGNIFVESTVGKGTIFRITIPTEPKSELGNEKICVNEPESLLSMTKKA
jgi:two-component system sensor kinase FixL